jgi:hypothetical protein
MKNLHNAMICENYTEFNDFIYRYESYIAIVKNYAASSEGGKVGRENGLIEYWLDISIFRTNMKLFWQRLAHSSKGGMAMSTQYF